MKNQKEIARMKQKISEVEIIWLAEINKVPT